MRAIDAEQAYEVARLYHSDFTMSLADLTSLREVLEDCDTIEVPRWIPVAERLPTEDDVNYHDLVLAKHRAAEDAEAWNYRAIVKHPSEFTVWMPMPVLPEE